MSQFNIHEAKAHFSELIQKSLLGEEVIIARDNKPLIKFVPVKSFHGKRRLGTAKNMFEIAADFDAPLEDFDDYTK